jgi:hypothetical protein
MIIIQHFLEDCGLVCCLETDGVWVLGCSWRGIRGEVLQVKGGLSGIDKKRGGVQNLIFIHYSQITSESNGQNVVYQS